CADIPDPQALGPVQSQEPSAVRTEGHVGILEISVPPTKHALARGDFPNRSNLLPGHRAQKARIRTESDAHHFFLVLERRSDLLTCGGVPELRGSIAARCGDKLIVQAE